MLSWLVMLPFSVTVTSCTALLTRPWLHSMSRCSGLLARASAILDSARQAYSTTLASCMVMPSSHTKPSSQQCHITCYFWQHTLQACSAASFLMK